MTGILIATKSEAHFFLKTLLPVKQEGIFHYRGKISGKNAALYLPRPGVSSPEQLRRFLRLYTYDEIISTGSCAALSSEVTRYESVQIGTAYAPGKKPVHFSDEKRHC